MSLQAIKHGLPFPNYPPGFIGVPALGTTLVIDAAGEKVAAICQASAAKSIHKIHVRIGTTTTGDTLDMRVETVDTAANGDPTGTLWATNTNGSLVLAGSDDNVWKSVTLTADATLAIGDVYALVVVQGASGNCIINGHPDMTPGFPYGDHFTASWAKTTSSFPMILAEYSDGSFEPIFGYCEWGGPINTNTFKSDDATNRRGNIFQLPFPTRVKGCWVWVDADAAFTVKLYDSDGSTVLATTASINAFQRVATTGNIHFFPFTTTATLVASTNYRLAVVPSVTTNLSTYDFDVPVAGMLDMFPGGQNCHASVFTSSAWVQTTTRRALMGVFLDAFDNAVDPASAGGGLIYGRLIP